MSETLTSVRRIRPLDARRRAAVRHWVPRAIGVFLLAVLAVAMPPAGPSSWSPGTLLMAVVAALPFGLAYLYVRNVTLAVENGRLAWTDLAGRSHSVPVADVSEMVGRRLWIGPLAVDVVALRGGQRDLLRLPRAAWNLDALEAVADRLGVPTRNADSAGERGAGAGGRRLAG